MTDQNKTMSRPIFRRDVGWDSFPNWTQPSRIFAQDYGLPPFLEPNDLDWLEWAKKRMSSFSWPKFTQNPALASFMDQQSDTADPKSARQLTCGVSEVQTGKNSWKINLDVNHFQPEEISITTKDGYLQIAGTHEEKQDEHSSVSRCFTRKYKLPEGVDLQHISSSLSTEGVLSVEAPVPAASSGSSDSSSGSSSGSSGPNSEVVIPVQIKETQDSERPSE